MNQAQARLASPTVEQIAAAHMLETIDAGFIDPIIKEYQNRRDVALKALQQLPKVQIVRPEGAFYALVGLPVEDSGEFARFMLENFSDDKATTFVAPAEGFYMQDGLGRSEIRVAFVLEADALKRAIEILGRGLEEYLRGGR
jgi:aspartate aminotransferase